MAALALMPALLLGFLGFLHFRDGRAVDSAVPVPVYMVAQIKLPEAAYVEAASALAVAEPRDGNASLIRAEALLHAGVPPAGLIEPVREALAHAPASARGWLLLSEVLYPSDKKKAASALAQALILAPREYWLIAPLSADAARLWDYLDADSRQAALSNVRLLWQEPLLHGDFRLLLQTQDGVSLAGKAFDSVEIRRINRWLRSEAMRRR